MNAYCRCGLSARACKVSSHHCFSWIFLAFNCLGNISGSVKCGSHQLLGSNTDAQTDPYDRIVFIFVFIHSKAKIKGTDGGVSVFFPVSPHILLNRGLAYLKEVLPLGRVRQLDMNKKPWGELMGHHPWLPWKNGDVERSGVSGRWYRSSPRVCTLPGVWIAQEQVTPAGSQVMQEVQIQADPLSAAEKLCACVWNF